MNLSLKEGEELVKTARKVVELALEGKEFQPSEEFKKKYSEKRGVFVTIKTFPEKELRGCIGYPYPIFPLWKALIDSAKAAAFEDPRFPPLRKDEINKVIFEVTVLTPPQEIKYKDPSELLEKIKIGKDGLIIQYGPYSGLLLPQVPVEEGWDVVEFLSYTCLKAGLPPDCWTWKGIKIYKFQGQIFEEVEPKGKVVEVVLKPKEK